jgi:hypothetical protein
MITVSAQETITGDEVVNGVVDGELVGQETFTECCEDITCKQYSSDPAVIDAQATATEATLSP